MADEQKQQEQQPEQGEQKQQRAPKEKKPKEEKPKKEKPSQQPKAKEGGKNVQKETLLGLDAKKDENFSDWYSQVCVRSELMDYYDISGCYIFRPWSYAIWEAIKEWFDAEIKKLGVQNAYFPLFISEKALTTEKDHIEGFAPEVAWVTKSGQSDLKEPIAVRPTSETIMYPAYSNWIRSHRDLPLKLNQWSNVVRWEFKHPVPFIRSREFLWQEGHTAFATKEEADAEVLQILDLYSKVYEELLAVPVIKGMKSEKEKFAGGLYTTTVEAFVPNRGWAIQGATSHCLGQNFSKMFNIQFETETGGKSLVWQNSWGLTTRTIGVMVMVHGDDKGLVLPPRVAPLQAVIVPIFFKNNDTVNASCIEVLAALKKAGIRTHYDERNNYTPGWKYNHWELKGVPLRIELGPRDIEKRQAVVVRRDTGEKLTIEWSVGNDNAGFDNLITKVKALLEEIQTSMLAKAKAERDSRISEVTQWDDFIPALERKHMVRAPWCCEKACEEDVKKRSSVIPAGASASNENEAEEMRKAAAAKTLCIPFEQPELKEGTCCFACGKPAQKFVMWGRSY